MKLLFYLFVFATLFPVYGLAQTGPSPTSDSTTAEPTKTNSSQTPEAQPAANSAAGGQNASSTELSQVVVVGQLDTVRDEIVPFWARPNTPSGNHRFRMNRKAPMHHLTR